MIETELFMLTFPVIVFDLLYIDFFFFNITLCFQPDENIHFPINIEDLN